MRELVGFGVEIELGRFASIECRLRHFSLLDGQAQAHEQTLDDGNFIAAYYAVCLAQSAHDGESRFDKVRLHCFGAAHQRVFEYPDDAVAHESADDQAAQASEQHPQQGAKNYDRHVAPAVQEFMGLPLVLTDSICRHGL
jgi:hypothetical protein